MQRKNKFKFHDIFKKKGEITKIEVDKKYYKSENLRQTTDEHVLAIFQKKIVYTVDVLKFAKE